MIQATIAKYALSKVLEYLFNKSKRFKKVLDYVHEENDADLRINELETKQAITDARIEHLIIEMKNKK